MPGLIVKIKSFASLRKNEHGEISLKDFVADQLRNQDNIDMPVGNPKEVARVNKTYSAFFGKQTDAIGDLCIAINTNDDWVITRDEIEAFDKKYGYDLTHQDISVLDNTVASWAKEAEAPKTAKAHHRRK